MRKTANEVRVLWSLTPEDEAKIMPKIADRANPDFYRIIEDHVLGVIARLDDVEMRLRCVSTIRGDEAAIKAARRLIKDRLADSMARAITLTEEARSLGLDLTDLFTLQQSIADEVDAILRDAGWLQGVENSPTIESLGFKAYNPNPTPSSHNKGELNNG